MKVLIAHNFYQQPGGEETVFQQEVELLREYGHEVITYTDHNDRIDHMSRMAAALDTLWSKTSYDRLRVLIAEHQPDIAHFHNIFPIISPSAYYACSRMNVPVVQTLHNFRLMCPAATFRRNDTICTDCLGKLPLPSLLHACYRDSIAASGVIVAMLSLHRFMGTWKNKVNIYITATNFVRDQFIQGRFPADKIMVKPHFLSQPPEVASGKGEYAVTLGRLSEEKGKETLVDAWKGVPEVSLKIVGTGPLEVQLKETARRQGSGAIEFVGRVERTRGIELIQRARFLIFPSICFETFGLTMVEAFACGIPVIASRLGAMAELIDDGRTGLHFEAGNADDLAAKVRWAWEHPEEMAEMGRNGRKEYEEKYTPERNYEMLMDIYLKAIDESKNG